MKTINNGGTMLTIEEQEKKGIEIAGILLLKKTKSGRYKTAWGDKTAIGIYNLMLSIKENLNYTIHEPL